MLLVWKIRVRKQKESYTHKDSFFHLPAESIWLTLKLMKLLLSLLLTTKAAALFPQKLCKKHAE